MNLSEFDRFPIMDLSERFPLLNQVQNIVNVEERLCEIRNQFRIPRRIFRDQLNVLEYYNEKKFRQNIGFTKDGFRFVLDIFKKSLHRPNNPGSPSISELNCLAIYLHYLRSGSFYRNEEDIVWIKLPYNTICGIVNKTAKIIASYSSQYIKFPDEEEKEIIANFFHENFHFPGCCGIFG